MQKKCGVFVVDDHAVVRQGLKTLIDQEADMFVCGEAEDGPSALRKLPGTQPNLAVVDISLTAMSGLDVIKAMKITYPSMPILAFSMHDETIYAKRVLHAGASGYLMKSEPSGVLIDAIRRVLRGKVYLSEKMTEQLLYQAISGRDESDQDIVKSLSDREFDVFQLIGRGLNRSHIAQKLNLSVKTIDAVRESIKHKLGLKSASELVAFAIEYARTSLQEERNSTER
jgi:DNA-binding NarL/FixJ family response regulator